MSQIVVERDGLQHTVLPAVQAALGNISIGLFVNDMVPTGSETVASFTVPTNSGYAPVVVATVGNVTIAADGNLTLPMPAAQFRAADASNADVVYGWFGYMGNLTTGHVIQARRFDDAPLAFASALDTITIVPAYPDALDAE
jgi:hypothetical protein